MIEERSPDDQSMWAYQQGFRNSIESLTERAFEDIGFQCSPRIFLVGFRGTGNHAFHVALEPNSASCEPEDFLDVHARAEVLYQQNPQGELRHNLTHVEKMEDSALQNAMRGEVVAEVFQNDPFNEQRTFFAGASTRVTDYDVYVVLGVATSALKAVPRLRTTRRAGFRVTPSLVHALIDDVLERARQALYQPDAGRGHDVLGALPLEIIRSAAARFVRSVFWCAGHLTSVNEDLILSDISALPYEGRAGNGNIILGRSQDRHVEIYLKLQHPAGLHDTRAVRKLLETSGAEVGLLVHGGNVYGVGRVKQDYDETRETVFTVSVLGRGAWDLNHAGQALLSLRDGVPHLPKPVLDIERFEDLVDHVFPDAHRKVLSDLAKAVGQHEHGAMLIISGDAAGEAERLSPQVWAVEPTPLSPEWLSQLTSMDGGILVDPQGKCYAIGVILDGRAVKGDGDPSRGSRFNNAIRYLAASWRPPAVVVVYSTDGSIDILPALSEVPPRVQRDEVASAVQRYIDLASARPPQLDEIYRARNTLTPLQFYLSEEQCWQVNLAHASLNEWRKQWGGPEIILTEMVPDPAMNDSYWI